MVLIPNLCIPCNKYIKYKCDISFFGCFSHYSVMLKKSNMQLKVVDLYLI